MVDLSGITLLGGDSVEVGVDRIYHEQGGTIYDAFGDILMVDAASGVVDTTTVGQYSLTYNAINQNGDSVSAVRTFNVVPSRAFITTWQTDKPGVSDDDQITIVTNSDNFAYDYTVDWGDGETDTGVTGDITHTYSSAGTYTVTISGDFPQAYFTDRVYDSAVRAYVPTSDPEKLLSVEQWGDIKWLSAKQAFFGAKNLVDNSEVTDYPDLRLVTDASSMFKSAEKVNGDTRFWQVGAITNMYGMFYYARNFNQDLSAWDVSSVTNMSSIFTGASNFNQDLSAWDVSSVTNMSSMFSSASNFNQDISAWDVSSVTSMSYMFYIANDFNQDLSAWDVSSVTTMTNMLRNSALSTANYDALLSGWSQLTLKTNVSFSVGSTQYSAASQAARDILTSAPNNWKITDGGVF